MIVRWTSPAAEDLRLIARFIRRDGPTAARHVAKTLLMPPTGSICSQIAVVPVG